jgi:hypothetical protein
MSPANCKGRMPRYPRPMKFTEVLTTFAEFFEREKIRWAIAGGVAVAAWGYERGTQDMDFVISGDDRMKVTTFAESLGYETVYASDSFSHHLHPTEAFGRVDAIYLNGRTADDVFAKATMRVAAGKLLAPIVSAEHIAMMKAFAIKNDRSRLRADARDIEFLLTLPGINRDEVRNYFARFGLLELFDDIDSAR